MVIVKTSRNRLSRMRCNGRNFKEFTMTLDRLGAFASATLSAALVAALAATTVATMIAPQSAHAEAGTPDIGVYVKGGTLGIGIGVAHAWLNIGQIYESLGNYPLALKAYLDCV